MTTILAVQTPQGAYLGADSQFSDDSKRIFSSSTPKIAKIGKFLVAGAGDCFPAELLTYHWKPPAYDQTPLIRFMGAKVVPSIAKVFKDHNYDHLKEGNSFSFLIVYRGEIFELAEDLTVLQADAGIYGIGSGSDYGVGYLRARISGLPIKEDTLKGFIEQAIQVASEYDVYTGGKIQLEYQPS
jgi:ATP-dependent protease HslVU (ClpYQ) peptidase subunit